MVKALGQLVQLFPGDKLQGATPFLGQVKQRLHVAADAPGHKDFGQGALPLQGGHDIIAASNKLRHCPFPPFAISRRTWLLQGRCRQYHILRLPGQRELAPAL